MKKFLTLLALLASFCINAQTIEIGGNIGLNNVQSPFFYSEGLPHNPGWQRYTYFGVSFLLNIKSWQTGIAMERFILDGNLKPALDSRVLLNRKFRLKGRYFYAGLTGGYFTMSTATYHYNPDIGYVVGLQAGATVRLWKHLSFNCEIAGRYATAWQKTGYHMHYGFLYIPTTVGLKYTF